MLVETVMILFLPQNYQVLLKMPSLPNAVHSVKLRLIPGPPPSLSVSPEEEITLENGKPVKFDVELRDKAGNLAGSQKLVVNCEVSGLLHVMLL